MKIYCFKRVLSLLLDDLEFIILIVFEEEKVANVASNALYLIYLFLLC